MQIFIMRHGEAKDFAEQYCVEDSERALTAEGEQESRAMANWLLQTTIKPTHVFVSPYVRAQQTCTIATADLTAVTTELEFITPFGDAKQVHDFIDGWHSDLIKADAEQEPCLLIVSHMPLVSFLVAELTQYESAPIFSPAAIVTIDYDPTTMKGQFVSLVSPFDMN